jgi:hypothetical protein
VNWGFLRGLFWGQIWGYLGCILQVEWGGMLGKNYGMLEKEKINDFLGEMTPKGGEKKNHR